jgi:hypothetical protein
MQIGVGVNVILCQFTIRASGAGSWEEKRLRWIILDGIRWLMLGKASRTHLFPIGPLVLEPRHTALQEPSLPKRPEFPHLILEMMSKGLSLPSIHMAGGNNFLRSVRRLKYAGKKGPGLRTAIFSYCSHTFDKDAVPMASLQDLSLSPRLRG